MLQHYNNPFLQLHILLICQFKLKIIQSSGHIEESSCGYVRLSNNSKTCGTYGYKCKQYLSRQHGSQRKFQKRKTFYTNNKNN